MFGLQLPSHTDQLDFATDLQRVVEWYNVISITLRHVY